MGTLHVDLGERSYPIYIERGLLAQAGSYFEQHQLGKKSPVLIVSDDNVALLYLDVVVKSLEKQGYTVVTKVVPAGEQSKSLSVFEDVMTAAIEGGLDRKSAVVALGGGVIGDLAGFVAASYMRGVTFVQMPTTILAHDSSVGGKVAVNHPLAKNMIGVFHQPAMVLYDIDTLKTLPPREIKAGLSEMIKHGLIWDKDFADWCEEHSGELLQLNPDVIQYGLTRGCAIKAQIVGSDETEQGLRAILNLGHTLGHAFEATAGYGRLLHGEAIAIGMAAAAKLAEYRGASSELYGDTVRKLRSFDLPVIIPADMSEESILAAMMHDKKFKENKLVFILPTEIGKVEIVSDVTVEQVRQVIAELKEA